MKRSSAASRSTLPPSGDGVDASDTDDISTVPSSGDEVEIQPKLGGRKKGRPTKKCGRKGRKGAGRPSGASPVKKMNSSRKRKYDREKKAVYRNQSNSPQKRGPPLTPETAKRKQEEKQKQTKLSKIRRQAALKRWKKESSESLSDGDGFTFDEDGNILDDQANSESSEHTSGKGCQFFLSFN